MTSSFGTLCSYSCHVQNFHENVVLNRSDYIPSSWFEPGYNRNPHDTYRLSPGCRKRTKCINGLRIDLGSNFSGCAKNKIKLKKIKTMRGADIQYWQYGECNYLIFAAIQKKLWLCDTAVTALNFYCHTHTLMYVQSEALPPRTASQSQCLAIGLVKCGPN